MAFSTIRVPITLLCVGAFNPVTNKHLRLMELARDSLHKTGKYDVVQAIFSPVHDKYPKQGLESVTHRTAMLKLAIQSSNDWLSIDLWESEQDGWTPSQVVLKKLQTKYSVTADEAEAEPSAKKARTSVSQPAMSMRLVCGGDLLESFAVPGLWNPEHIESIVRDFGLVCIDRPGSNPQKTIYESDILTKYSENIQLVTDWFGDEFSSTKVRRALRRGESIKYVVQDSVIDYIKQHNLYTDKQSENSGPSTFTPHLDLDIEHSMKISSCSGYFSSEPSPVDRVNPTTKTRKLCGPESSSCSSTPPSLIGNKGNLYATVRPKSKQNCYNDRSRLLADEEEDVRLQVIPRSETMPSPLKMAASSFQRASLRSSDRSSVIPVCTCHMSRGPQANILWKHHHKLSVQRSQSFNTAQDHCSCPPALPPRSTCIECNISAGQHTSTQQPSSISTSSELSDSLYSTVKKTSALDKLISRMKKFKV